MQWKVGDYVAKVGLQYRAIYEVTLVSERGGMIKVVQAMKGHDNLGKEFSFPASYPLEKVDFLPAHMIRRVRLGRCLDL